MAANKSAQQLPQASKFMIMGYEVYFPERKRPFSSQMAVMAKIMQALRRNENALIESPTGTGKTLAILCSTLSWQLDAEKVVKSVISEEAAKPPAPTINKNTVIPPGGLAINVSQPTEAKSSKPVSTIFYCSRTHSQLAQVAGELRSFLPIEIQDRPSGSKFRMTILSSRKQSCINRSLTSSSSSKSSSAPSIDDACRSLISTNGCSFYHHFDDILPVLPVVWDVEDIVSVGKRVRGCPYYAMRESLPSAHIVLCPYNFLLDKEIRKQVKINLDNNIIVFDEAHNLEDAARSCAGHHLTYVQMEHACLELSRLSETSDRRAFTELGHFCNLFLSWFNALNLLNLNEKICVRSGYDAIVMLEDTVKLTYDRLQVLMSFLDQVKKLDDEDGDNQSSSSSRQSKDDGNEEWLQRRKRGSGSSQGKHPPSSLSKMTTTLLSSLFTVLDYLLTNDMINSKHYRLVLYRNQTAPTMHFMCLSASVVFADFKSCRSMILTSGTLSPMANTSSELGINFPITLEASHVIDVSKQVSVNVISEIDDFVITSKFDQSDSPVFHDAAGKCVMRIANTVVGGILVFVPSYSLLEKLKTRWEESNLLSQLEESIGKSVFFEPKGPSSYNNNSNDGDSPHNSFDEFLQSYNRAIDESIHPSSTSKKKKTGAILFAVCRGKLSEGIDFTDYYSRVVIIIGIPYPNYKDVFIQLKKEVQTQLAASNHGSDALNGDDWYKQQAMRAVNQAAGRCIRHKNDFGAIFLIDARYKQGDLLNGLSRWMRGCADMSRSSLDDDVIRSVEEFFQRCNRDLSSSSSVVVASAVASLPVVPFKAPQAKTNQTRIELYYEQEKESIINVDDDDRTMTMNASEAKHMQADDDDVVVVDPLPSRQSSSQSPPKMMNGFVTASQLMPPGSIAQLSSSIRISPNRPPLPSLHSPISSISGMAIDSHHHHHDSMLNSVSKSIEAIFDDDDDSGLSLVDVVSEDDQVESLLRQLLSLYRILNEAESCLNSIQAKFDVMQLNSPFTTEPSYINHLSIIMSCQIIFKLSSSSSSNQSLALTSADIGGLIHVDEWKVDDGLVYRSYYSSTSSSSSAETMIQQSKPRALLISTIASSSSMQPTSWLLICHQDRKMKMIESSMIESKTTSDVIQPTTTADENGARVSSSQTKLNHDDDDDFISASPCRRALKPKTSFSFNGSATTKRGTGNDVKCKFSDLARKRSRKGNEK